MKSSNPKISVILPVYNAEKYIYDSINSILSQTFQDFELVIIDDCSTDSSYDLIKEIASFDSRIRIFKNKKNLRLIDTLNFGLSVSQAKYVARMDADDICEPNRLEIQYNLIVNSGAVIVGSNYRVFGSKNRIIYNPSSNESCKAALLTCSPFCHPAVMMNLDIIKKNDIKYSKEYLHAEDYEFFIRLSKFGNVMNSDEILFNYRFHDNQISQKHSKQQMETRIKAIVDHYQVSPNNIVSGLLEKKKVLNNSVLSFYYKGLLELLLYTKEKLSLSNWINILIYSNKKEIFKYLIKRFIIR